MKAPILTFILGLLVFGELVAQQRRTVLLNTNPEPLKFTFQSNFPFPVTLANKGVKLHQWLHSNTLDETQFQIFNVKKNEVNIGQKRIVKENTFVETPLNIKEWKQEVLNLKGDLPSDNKKITFYGSNPSLNPYSINKQPKLVIDYEVTKEPYGTAWSQLDGNAQHSSNTDWTFRFGQFIDELSLKETKVDNYTADDIKYISSYQTSPIFISNKPTVFALSSDLQKELWHLPLQALPVQQPVISTHGQMIVVSKNALEVIDLNEKKVIGSKALSDVKINIEKGNTHSINRLTNEMTMGYDGTLYMPIANADSSATAKGNFGIVALSAYPQLLPRWFYNTTNNVGPVSLSQNEKMAFFIETNRKSEKSRLVVLDNINGTILTTSEDILTPYSNDGNSYIPPVVVQTINKDTSVVYVLDGNKTSNKLFIFKITHNQFFDKNGIQKEEIPHLAYFKLLQSTNPKNAGISQPAVLNNKQILLAKDKQLYTYNIDLDILKILQYSDDKHLYLDNISDDARILCNRSNSAYVLSENRLFFLKVKENRDAWYFRLLISNADFKQAALTSHLSLYTYTEKGSLKYFYPTYRQNTTNSLQDFEHKYVYVANKIDIQNINTYNLTVPKNIQSIVQGTEIRFKKGNKFTVQKGASLTFQIRK